VGWGLVGVDQLEAESRAWLPHSPEPLVVTTTWLGLPMATPKPWPWEAPLMAAAEVSTRVKVVKPAGGHRKGWIRAEAGQAGVLVHGMQAGGAGLTGGAVHGGAAACNDIGSALAAGGGGNRGAVGGGACRRRKDQTADRGSCAIASTCSQLESVRCAVAAGGSLEAGSRDKACVGGEASGKAATAGHSVPSKSACCGERGCPVVAGSSRSDSHQGANRVVLAAAD
jgi:hypothetical protein